MSTIITLKDPNSIFTGRKTVAINPGLTIIAGCNGAGKSTLANEIARNFRNKHINFVYLDCRKSFHQTDLEYFDKAFKPLTILNGNYLSEHEYYESMFSDWLATTRPSDAFKGHKFGIIIDGLDSGGDVNFYKRHTNLFNLVVNDAKARGIEMYLIVTCNNFYYLSHSDIGEVVFCPTFKRRKLPCYSTRQFDKYECDILETAKARGFLDD